MRDDQGRSSTPTGGQLGNRRPRRGWMILRAVALLLVLLASGRALAFGISEDCIQSVADSLGGVPQAQGDPLPIDIQLVDNFQIDTNTEHFMPHGGTVQIPVYSSQIAYFKGPAGGQAVIRVSQFELQNHLDKLGLSKGECSAGVKAILAVIIEHEVQHGSQGCGASGNGACAHLSMRLGSYQSQCDDAGALGDCLDMNLENGMPCPGVEPEVLAEDAQEVFDALCASLGQLHGRLRQPDAQEEARDCACSGEALPAACETPIPEPSFGCDDAGEFGENYPVGEPCEACG